MSFRSPFRQSLIAAAVGLLLLPETAGLAQTRRTDDGLVQSHGFGGLVTTDASYPTVQPGKRIDVEPGQAASIELPIPIGNGISLVSLGIKDAAIRSVSGFDRWVVNVDVNSVPPGCIGLTATSVGETTLLIKDENDTVTEVTVAVTNKVPQRLVKLIEELFPDADIDLHSINQSVLIRGTVAKPDDVTNLIDIAQQFYPQVLNQIVVKPVESPDVPYYSPTPAGRTNQPLRLDRVPQNSPSKPADPSPVPMRVPEGPVPTTTPTTPEAAPQDFRAELKALHTDVKRLIELLESRQPKINSFEAPSQGAGEAPQGEPMSYSPAVYGTPGQRQFVWDKLGLRLMPLPFSYAMEFNNGLKGGMRITKLREDYPELTKAGLRERDILIYLGPSETNTFDDLTNILYQVELSKTGAFDFQVVRNRKLITGELNLSNRVDRDEESSSEQSLDVKKGMSDRSTPSRYEVLSIDAPFIKRIAEKDQVPLRQELVLLADGQYLERISTPISEEQMRTYRRRNENATFSFDVGFSR